MTARRSRSPDRPRITVHLDGTAVPAFEGEPLAAALLAAGYSVFGRSVKYHRPRGAPCGGGHCAHCLMRVDGVPNVAACRTPCHDGLTAERQNVLGGAEHDLLGATDWLFPRGLDHHEMFTGVPLVQPVVQKVVRKLSGLGRLPDTRAEAATVQDREVEVLVVGGGLAGTAAARAAEAEGREVLLVEGAATLGGRALTGLHPEVRLSPVTGVEVLTSALAVQADRASGRLLVGVDTAEGLLRVWPRRLVVATGGYPTFGLVENGDLPGVIDLAWAATLLHRHGLLAGERVVLCADGPAADPFAASLAGAGARVVRHLPAAAAWGPAAPDGGPRLVQVTGSREATGVVVEADGAREKLACDLVVLGLPPAPAFELAAAAGAKVAWRPDAGGFAVVTDATGRTSRDDVLACGVAAGHLDPEASVASGKAAGAAAAEGAADAA